MKNCILLITLLLFYNNMNAQKQTYDIVTYTAPAGWTSQQGNDYAAYSRIDGSSWAQIAIYQHRTSGGSIQADFDKEWNELIASSKTISAPDKTQPQSAEGWTVMSGSGVWQYNGANVACILTVYSNNAVCVSVLCNATAQPYLKDYQALLGSLDLDVSNVPQAAVTNPSSTATEASPSASTNTTSIVGLWSYNMLETSGYINNMPQYTAGYFRKEYLFKADGTYIFRIKNWSAYMKDIYFVYESGTYAVNGNQLTVTPRQGISQSWSRTSSNKEWGKLTKSMTPKLETITYTFEFHYYSGTKETALLLKYARPTTRDGASNSNNQENTWSYSPRALDKSLIDNPPGFALGVENNSSAAIPAQKTNLSAIHNTVNSSLAGKIWEGRTTEKFVGGTMNGYYTGGYFTYQYKFNPDGTYRFIYVGASAYTDPNLLQHETGTYAINGNQLTITPVNGANEEWSVSGGPIKLAAMSDMQIGKIKEQWDKRIKTSKRKLEPVTYTFKVEYMTGNKVNALVVQYNDHTEREGNGSTAYYYETAPGKSTVLPAGIFN